MIYLGDSCKTLEQLGRWGLIVTCFQWGRRRHLIHFLNSVLHKISSISFSEVIRSHGHPSLKSPQVDRNPMVFYQKLDNSESESEIGLPVALRARVSRFTPVLLNYLFCKLRAHWLATGKSNLPFWTRVYYTFILQHCLPENPIYAQIWLR